MQLQDKVIIVTGASSGIGKALVEESLRLGARVVLAARRIEPMKEIINGELAERYLLVQTDVSSESDCKQLIEKTIERFGRIDVLINNAGISMRALFSEADLSVIQRLMEVNFWGAVYCSKYALPYLIASRGSLVGVSSIAGFKGLPARSGYSASKFALQGFLESVRVENLKSGLHVLIACPGFTASNIRKTALAKDGSIQGESPRAEEKMMTAETVAKCILFSVIRRKRTLVLTTQGKLTMWINKFFPGLTDRLVYKHLAKEPDSPLKQ